MQIPQKKETTPLPADLVRTLAEIKNHISATWQPFLKMQEALAGSVTAMESSIRHARDQIAPALAAMAEAYKTLPDRTRTELRILGEHGWYLDFDMPTSGLRFIATKLESGHTAEADETLKQYYRGRARDIEAALIAKFSTRATPISQAFKAHGRGEYYLSIPVFLAQADGVCKAFTTLQLFSRDDGVPKTASHVQSIESELISSLFYPLTIPLPISASEYERATLPEVLNRHAVLHGESLDYGTEANSLKAISLLYYIGSVLTWQWDE